MKFLQTPPEDRTIPCIPLITGSAPAVLAAGAEGLVVDVKWGNGAFVNDLEQAKLLARSITRVGRSMKRRCVALVIDMNQPLGSAVGTGLEIKEAIELLKGEGPEDLKLLVQKLGMEIVRLAELQVQHFQPSRPFNVIWKMALPLKNSKMVVAQGGNSDYLENPDKFKTAKYVKASSPKRGYVHAINNGMIAWGVQMLSTNKSGKIDHAVGVTDVKKVGTQVKQGETFMMIHYNDEARLSLPWNTSSQLPLAPKRPNIPDLIVERVA